ncbi:MAG: hypothetical protein H6922_03220 [Pseudomonadaceae bacterium]|nr:hypothetical protein [Pseudomonadaceae bacterium]
MSHTHFIGIAGIAMSAVALLLRQKGESVSGSDEGMYPPASEILPAAGITISSPYAAANIPPETTRIVIGKTAKVNADNPEFQEALRRQQEGSVVIQSYPEVLADATAGRHNIVVCGSYGKSTTASLAAWMLTHAGIDAGYMLGARALNFAGNSHVGTAAPFVMEGDEYPSSNMDDRAKFLHYAPSTVILTSAQHDHPNVFPTHADYLKPFQQLLAKLTPDQLLVACADDAHAMALLPQTKARVVTYGTTAGDYRVENPTFGATSTFMLSKNGTPLCEISTHELGLHNMQNMAGAGAALLEDKLLTPAQVVAALAAFKGVKRRMERLNPTGSIPLYEGFGSSADKARSAIAAMRLHFPDNRLVVVFEPHTFGWRNPVNLPDYDTAFTGADELFVYPPHAGAGLLSHQEILARLQTSFSGNLHPLGENLPANLATLQEHLEPKDVVLLLTSGDLGGLIPPLAELLTR